MKTMDAGSIVGLVFLSIFGFLFLVTCIVSAVKAVKDRHRIKQKIAAKQAARIILQKPSVINRQLSRSSDDILTPIGSSGGGLIAERMKREEKLELNKSPAKRPFELITSDRRYENRLEKRQYLERNLRKHSGAYENFEGLEFELQNKDLVDNGFNSQDPYRGYFSSNDNLYVNRRWNDDNLHNKQITTRNHRDFKRPTKSHDNQRYASSKSLPSPNDNLKVCRSQSTELLSRTSSRQSVRRNSYEAAMRNDEYFCNGLDKSDRVINVYRCDSKTKGLENRGYMKSDDIWKQVSL